MGDETELVEEPASRWVIKI